MKKSRLSLKWLEVFQQVARFGSVQRAAEETGLSISTVSHHLKSLETTLGTPLFDHSRRPMRVTPSGAVFLRHVDEAMRHLHKAELDMQSDELAETRSLSLAMIEDFETEIAPDLARALSLAMPHCSFRHLTRPSHDILDRVRRQEIDIGIAAQPQYEATGLQETPLLRDPFVLAVPSEQDLSAEACLSGTSPLPFLRYSREEIMGRQIDAQLTRLRISLPDRYEFESNQTIMSMVAEGAGWAITTPTNYVRATRFQRQVRLLEFPSKGFARRMCVYTSAQHPSPLVDTVTSTLRQLIQSRAIDPSIARMPWLRDGFTLLESAEG